MVGKVVSGQVLDPSGVAVEMGGGDLDELAVLGGDRERIGSVHQAVLVGGGEESGGDHGGHVVAGVSAFDDLGDRSAPDRELMDHMFWLGGHGCIVGAAPDTTLTRAIRRTLHE